MMAGILVRRATRADAACVADLTDMASEGLAGYFWAQEAAPGESPLTVGTRKAEAGEGNFSWRNAAVAMIDGAVAGMILAYRLAAPDHAGLDELPPIIRTFVALEHEVPGSFYVNALAVHPQLRGRGVASALLHHARLQAQAADCRQLSIQVFESNLHARTVYARSGYRQIARRPIRAQPAWPRDDAVLLLVRPVQ